jgi:PAS domain S-box-containing protein
MTKKRDPGKTIEVLFKISEAVSNTRNLGELYKVIHQSLDEILNVDNFYIALYHEKKDSITFPYYVDEKDYPADVIKFSQKSSLTGMVIKNQKPMIFYQDDNVRIATQFQRNTIGTISKVWLGAPLIINSKVKGAIAIQSYESASAYEKNDLELLNSVSQHIALAIERKESEEALTKQQQVLEKILESSPVGIALIQNRVFKWVNNEMVKMFGYESKSQMENKSTRMIYASTDDYELAGKKIYSSFAISGAADYEMELVKKDQTLFPGHVLLNSGDTSNPMSWTIATVTDISQRKSAEKETYEKQKLQGVLEMAGAICHEINQPLQSILGYSELMLMDSQYGQEDNMEDYNLKSITSQASRLGKITKKLSKITRYRTIDYPGNTKIVDIWEASDDMET